MLWIRDKESLDNEGKTAKESLVQKLSKNVFYLYFSLVKSKIKSLDLFILILYDYD